MFVQVSFYRLGPGRTTSSTHVVVVMNITQIAPFHCFNDHRRVYMISKPFPMQYLKFHVKATILIQKGIFSVEK